MSERVDVLIELLHEMMSDLFDKVGEEKKAALLQCWHDFYAAWTSEADNG